MTEDLIDDDLLDYDGDQEDLAARRSLRRVAGMRTELEDVTEVEYRQLRLERVVLVSVWTSGTQQDADNAMAELKLLAETAGSEVLDALVQRRSHPDPSTYVGSGKVEEVAEVVRATGVHVAGVEVHDVDGAKREPRPLHRERLDRGVGHVHVLESRA